MSYSRELDDFTIQNNLQTGRFIQRVLDLPKRETYKPIDRLHYVDILEGQETRVTWRLPPPQLLGYMDK